MKLYCGKLEYEYFNYEIEKAIKGLIFWSYILTKERKESSPDEEIIQTAEITLKDLMEDCEKLKIPNWVGNGAMQFGRDNDLRSVYIMDFFTKSKYSQKAM